MGRMFRSKKGEIVVGVLVAQLVIGGLTGLGLAKTAANGVLANNMKVIGCKVMNNGEQYCNEKYGYMPKRKIVKPKSGGKLRAKLLAMQLE